MTKEGIGRSNSNKKPNDVTLGIGITARSIDVVRRQHRLPVDDRIGGLMLTSERVYLQKHDNKPWAVAQEKARSFIGRLSTRQEGMS